MSVVSGIATSSGAVTRLNVPGSDKADSTKNIENNVGSASTDAVRIDKSAARIVERVASVSDGSERVPLTGAKAGLTPGDGRYSRFVDAVQALRLDESTAAELTPERVAELKAAAAEVFNIRSDIPREQRPSEVLDEQRPLEAERKLNAEIERDEAVQQVRDAERSALGSQSTQVVGTMSEGMTVAAIPDVPVPEAVVAQPVPDAPDSSGPQAGTVSEPSGDTSAEATVATPSGSTPSAPEPSAAEPV